MRVCVLLLALAVAAFAKVQMQVPPEGVCSSKLSNVLPCLGANGKKSTRCMLRGDPQLTVRSYRSRAMPIGANWLANWQETPSYRLQAQTFHCRWRGKVTTVCGFSVTLPNGRVFSVFDDGKTKRMSVDCKRQPEHEINHSLREYVKISKQRVFICLGSTTIALLTAPMMKVTVWAPRCRFMNAHGWCSAPYNKAFYSQSVNGYAPNPAKVAYGDNLFFCRVRKVGKPAMPALPKTKPAPFKCDPAVRAKAQQICALGFRKFDSDVCPYGTYSDDCVDALCLSFEDRRIMLARTIRDYLDEYLQRGITCPFSVDGGKLTAAPIIPKEVKVNLPSNKYRACFRNCINRCTPSVAQINADNQKLATKLVELRVKSASCADGKKHKAAASSSVPSLLRQPKVQQCWVKCYVNCEVDPLEGKPWPQAITEKVVRKVYTLDANGKMHVKKISESVPGAQALANPGAFRAAQKAKKAAQKKAQKAADQPRSASAAGAEGRVFRPSSLPVKKEMTIKALVRGPKGVVKTAAIGCFFKVGKKWSKIQPAITNDKGLARLTVPEGRGMCVVRAKGFKKFIKKDIVSAGKGGHSTVLIFKLTKA